MMIEIKNLNKYYSKKSSSPLHVINDVSLKLPSLGLVTFLGKSGSGKTTLLNVISGNDKFLNGSISFDDVTFKKYKAREIDIYRQSNIGYIFQNYLLLNDINVYDNLVQVLELIGINDKEEQKRRIEYALKVVGLYKYRKKLAGKLSGGEMQRVSIARALVKKSKVIIADEPTGNLDSENKIEIMNVLKQISKTTLVLLVTHSEELAYAYSDRIIRIQDGKVSSDSESEGGIVNTSLNLKSDKVIHLLDYQKVESSNGGLNIEFYKDDSEVSTSLRIVLKNNTLYIDSPSKLVLASDSNIVISNDHQEEIKKVETTNDNFDISFFDDSKKGHLSFYKNLLNAVKRFFNSSKKQKAFRFIFFAFGVVISVLTSNIGRTFSIDRNSLSNEDVYVIERNYGSSYFAAIDIDKVMAAKRAGTIEDIYYSRLASGASVAKLNVNSKISDTYSFDSFVYPYKIVEEEKFLFGRAPTTFNEICLGQKMATKLMEEFKLSNYEYLVNLEINLSYSFDVKVCGVVETKTNSIYTLTDIYNGIDYIDKSMNVANIYKLNGYPYKIVEGREIDPLSDSEIMLSENVKDIGVNISDIIGDFEVVGFFEKINPNREIEAVMNLDIDNTYLDIEKDEDGNFLMHYYTQGMPNKSSLNPKRFHDKYASVFINYNSVKDSVKIVSGNAPIGRKEVLVPLGYNVNEIINRGYEVSGYYYQNNDSYTLRLIGSDECWLRSIHELEFLTINDFFFTSTHDGESITYEDETFTKIEKASYNAVLEANKSSRNTSLTVSGVLLLIIVIYVYFMSRSRILNDIRNVGVLRNIGATKKQIRKKYLIDTYVETFFTSFLGYVVVAILYIGVLVKFALISNTFIDMPLIISLILGGIFLFVINIVSSLIPVGLLLRKTPSEIISKYDI